MKIFLTTVTSTILVLYAPVGCSDEVPSLDPGTDADLAEAHVGAEAAPIPTDAADADVTTVPADAGVSYDGAALPITCTATPCVLAIAAGAEHYCAILADQTLRCWGDTTALPVEDDGGEPAVGAPTAVAGLGPVHDFDLTGNTTCVVDATTAVWCWSATQRVPTRATEVLAATRVFVGGDERTRCALLPSSDLQCWGDSDGVRRVDLQDQRAHDVRLGTDVGIVATSDGTTFSWGSGLRTAQPYPSPVPRPIHGLNDTAKVAVGERHACALSHAGALECWGEGTSGQLGTGVWRDELAPTAVALPAGVAAQAIDAESTHTCIRSTASEVYCWGGINARGELGQIVSRGVYAPTHVVLESGAGVAQVAVGRSSSCALRSDGTVVCWGDNSKGQLARGSVDSNRHPEPRPVVFP